MTPKFKLPTKKECGGMRFGQMIYKSLTGCNKKQPCKDEDLDMVVGNTLFYIENSELERLIKEELMYHLSPGSLEKMKLNKKAKPDDKEELWSTYGKRKSTKKIT